MIALKIVLVFGIFAVGFLFGEMHQLWMQMRESNRWINELQLRLAKILGDIDALRAAQGSGQNSQTTNPMPVHSQNEI